MSEFLGLTPNYTNIYTAAEGMQEFGLTWRGPGIYHGGNGDTLLVLPIGRTHGTTWHSKTSPEEKFEFHVYNGRTPSHAINLLCNAPTRNDERDEVSGNPAHFPGDEEDGTRGRMYAEENRNERRF